MPAPGAQIPAHSVLFCIICIPRYTASDKHNTIKAEFEDSKVALLQFGADGIAVVADDARASAAAEMDPDTFLVGDELAERVGE